MTRSAERGHPCFVRNLSRDALSFSPLGMMLAMGFPYILCLFVLKYVPSISGLFRVFNNQGMFRLPSLIECVFEDLSLG